MSEIVETFNGYLSIRYEELKKGQDHVILWNNQVLKISKQDDVIIMEGYTPEYLEILKKDLEDTEKIVSNLL